MFLLLGLRSLTLSSWHPPSFRLCSPVRVLLMISINLELLGFRISQSEAALCAAKSYGLPVFHGFRAKPNMDRIRARDDVTPRRFKIRARARAPLALLAVGLTIDLRQTSVISLFLCISLSLFTSRYISPFHPERLVKISL